jgi:hypothetical protein
MVVITLMSLIVLALMAVFNSTQTVFRASVTQADVLEGGRATMDLMADDLRQMAPSFSNTNVINPAANFYADINASQYRSQPSPLVQSLIGSAANRTNVLEYFFLLSRGHLNGSPAWFGTGYAVDTASTNSINPLYRFYMSTNVAANPWGLFDSFTNAMISGAWTNWSHLLDGVVGLRVRAFDPKGYWMTNYVDLYAGQFITNQNMAFLSSAWGETGLCMFSNTLPASVEIELGVLEDRTLQRAESLGASQVLQSNYLAGAAGKVHVFRQRVTIPNVDPSAYQ